jgi:hypothetical protein
VELNGGSSRKCNLWAACVAAVLWAFFVFAMGAAQTHPDLDYLHSNRNCRCVRYLEHWSRYPAYFKQALAMPALNPAHLAAPNR